MYDFEGKPNITSVNRMYLLSVRKLLQFALVMEHHVLLYMQTLINAWGGFGALYSTGAVNE